MQGLREMVRRFCSYTVVLILLAILGIGGAIATFIESAYDTQTAKILIYDARWYEAIMVLSALSLIGLIYKTRMWKRMGSFLIHLSFIVILIGAGLTRYFGYEGIIHIREGQHEHEMITVVPYLHIQTHDTHLEYPLTLGQLGNNDFSFSHDIQGKPLVIRYKDYRYHGKGERASLEVYVSYGTQMRTLLLKGGAGWIEEPVIASFEGLELALTWGSKVMDLPFSLALRDFELKRYAGSMSPSSYSSDIEVLDTNNKPLLAYQIFMNHPLHYAGYTFFQSSYDLDELGTVLEINKDPGKWPTYAGYFLLTLGFLSNFFTKGSRFLKLRAYLKNVQLLWLLLCFSLCGIDAKANTTLYLEHLAHNSAVHAKEDLSSLLIQDMQGRIKPFSTEALEIVHKLTSGSSLYHLRAEQIILGMSAQPQMWQEIPPVKLNNTHIKELLNLPHTQNLVSFAQVFDANGAYKLAHAINEANQKPQSKRGTFENDLIKFDEKLNIAYLTFKGVLFKFVPLPNDKNHTWLTPNDALQHPLIDTEIKNAISIYFSGLQEGINHNEWTQASHALYTLKRYQKLHAQEVIPSQTRIQAELLYNHLALFQKLIGVYFTIGCIAFFLALFSLFTQKQFKRLETLLIAAFSLGLLIHTFALGLRWYVSGHAPWSDSYESMVYIGWSAAFAGLVVFRRSMLSLCAASIFAGIMMLVSHMSFVNPQITNLVPVLKSYWLSIHVSVITASYGFLGLGALLGLLSLMLMACKTKNNENALNEQIRTLYAINEISLIIGLSMLAIGNFFGGIWANESWGRYWGWDPKETWSYVSILVYAFILHMRFVPKIYSVFSFSLASVFGFSSIIMTYFGVNFYLTGMHSYAATGESPSIPTGVYYAIGALVALSLIAYRGRHVRTI
jgi:cytochrome c-type biogenesis protein CcsB